MDNSKHKKVCLLLESSITELFYYNDYIPQFPEQEPLIAKIVHFNSIFIRIHWNYIVDITYALWKHKYRGIWIFKWSSFKIIYFSCLRLQIQE